MPKSKINTHFTSSVIFPDPHHSFAEGLVAMGGRLDVGTLYTAYSKGIFPWPQEGFPLLWFCPEKRGVLCFDELHVSHSLEKERNKRTDLVWTTNKAFKDVVQSCREQFRPFQKGTWILPEMKEAYFHFHEAGFAHSVECWKGDELVGGIYGVLVEGVFSGESMFHKESNTSKLSLLHLIDLLKNIGLRWMDIQMVTPVLERMGGRYISRNEFLLWVKKAQADWAKERGVKQGTTKSKGKAGWPF